MVHTRRGRGGKFHSGQHLRGMHLANTKLSRITPTTSIETPEQKPKLHTLNVTHNSAHFSYLELFPGVKIKTKEERTLTESGDEVFNERVICKPTGNFYPELNYIKEELKIDLLIGICSRKELMAFGVIPQHMAKFAASVDLNWMWCQISANSYREHKKVTKQWKLNSVRAIQKKNARIK